MTDRPTPLRAREPLANLATPTQKCETNPDSARRAYFFSNLLKQDASEILVFMVASHGGEQFLVAVAGRAKILTDSTRRKLAKKLSTVNRWKHAWRLPSVQAAYERLNETQDDFRAQWNRETRLAPPWGCPAELYLGFKTPLLIHPPSITGKESLIREYSRHQYIDRHTALHILDVIPTAEYGYLASRLKALCEDTPQDKYDDLNEINRQTLLETTKRALIDVRLGQGRYRADLMQVWGGRCAVTGCSLVEVLRASHIKPWRLSKPGERLDPDNGLLLTAHLDALFDVGLISFDDNGSLLISRLVPESQKLLLRLTGGLSHPPSMRMRGYLRFHRNRVARGIDGTSNG